MAAIEVFRNINGYQSEAEASLSFGLKTLQDNAWPFHCGDPELWKFKDSLFVPGGRVLDIGIGAARVSLPFALWGMHVDGYEQNGETVDWLNNMKSAYGLDIPLNVQQADIWTAEVPSNLYDLVLMSHTFTHFDDKERAYDVLQKGFDAAKSGSHIWVRALGKEDSFYREADTPYSYAHRASEDVIEAPCGCSGEIKHDPFLFFDQTELISYFSARNSKIVHSQIIPQYGETNIMYGKDDLFQHPDNRFKDNGIVSILVQKR